MTDAYESHDEPLQLPADTLAALAEFQQEKTAREQRFADLKSKAEERFDAGQALSMDLFSEDWNASQFWYTDATAKTLAHQLLADATADSAIAVVSAPSVFVALKNMLNNEGNKLVKPRILLLEYDQRFDVFEDEFQTYDFANPLRLPAELQGAFDRIIVDPPFLSEDCQTKTAITARFLAKSWNQDKLKLISCTGERMESNMLRLYGTIGIKTTTFEPE